MGAHGRSGNPPMKPQIIGRKTLLSYQPDKEANLKKGTYPPNPTLRIGCNKAIKLVHQPTITKRGRVAT